MAAGFAAIPRGDSPTLTVATVAFVVVSMTDTVLLPPLVAKALLLAVITDNVVEPTTLPKVAVIAVVPMATAVASPLELVMVAIPVIAELQVTKVVKSCVAPFDRTPVALNCRVVPTAALGLAGVTPTDETVVAVSVVELEIPPAVAVMVVVPGTAAVASPFEPTALLMEATPGFDDVQVTVVVIS